MSHCNNGRTSSVLCWINSPVPIIRRSRYPNVGASTLDSKIFSKEGSGKVFWKSFFQAFISVAPKISSLAGPNFSSQWSEASLLFLLGQLHIQTDTIFSSFCTILLIPSNINHLPPPGSKQNRGKCSLSGKLCIETSRNRMSEKTLKSELIPQSHPNKSKGLHYRTWMWFFSPL